MAKDLTTGRIPSLLARFTVPLVLGNLLQLTYNAADSAIVGRFVGREALAAIGACNPVSTLMILVLNGICLGAGVLMGILYGAKDYDTLHRQVSTTMLAGAGFSLALSAVCVAGARPLLLLLRVDASILDLSVEYLRIIFCGVAFTYLYNFFASTLRALGDSRTPLYFLAVSAALNIVGDLFFVIVLGWGSRGCALATVLSEALCCLFCVLYIRRSVPVLRLGRGWLRFDASLLKKTMAYGWASAMQQGSVQVGKIIVQALVNTMGVPVAAAFAVVNRVDDFAIMPEQNISHAMTALMAQNLGAGRRDRMKEGFRWGLVLESMYAALVMVLFFVLAGPIMRLFTTDAEVIGHGVIYLHGMALIYILPGITNGLQGYFRGIGRLQITLFSSLVNIGTRVVVAFWLVRVLHFGIEALPYAYFAGWFAMLVAELPVLVHSYRKKNL